MSVLNQHELNYIADQVDRYLRAHEIAVIHDGIRSEKKYKEGMHDVKQALKKLRKGKCNDKIFDMEMLEVFADSIRKEASSSS